MVATADRDKRPITFRLIHAPNSVSGAEKCDLQLPNSARKLISGLSVSVLQPDLEASEEKGEQIG